LGLKILTEFKNRKRARQFKTSDTYWETRYAKGGDSGTGSYGRLSEFKAELLNAFVESNAVKSVIEFGCGDGNQLTLANYPQYIGLDVSLTIIQSTSARFSVDDTKSFFFIDTRAFVDNAGLFKAELSLSLDVIYHLVEDSIFEAYMDALFGAGTRYVIVYSSNKDEQSAPHVRHREFTKWVEQNKKDWVLKEKIENRFPYDPASPHETSLADFYVFERA
jgi:SAM-dependent methyltransferase